MAKNYTAESITVRDAMDGVRAHPGMYLGNIDAKGSFHALLEILQNASDELSINKLRLLDIQIDGTKITVADSGRGIPIAIHSKTKQSALETVFSKLHAGAKSGDKSAYGNTIGVHGVGASVTNALSTKFQVWTRQKGSSWHSITFAKGQVTKALHKAKPPIQIHKTGTVVYYERDISILPDEFDPESVRSWCRLAANFHQLEITLSINGKRFRYKAGSPEKLLQRQLSTLQAEPLVPTFQINEGGVRCICTWVEGAANDLQTFVVGSPTLGGTHAKGLELALRSAFQAVFKSLAAPKLTKRSKKTKTKEIHIDWSVGLVGILDVSIDQPSFEGQNKTRLATRAATKLVQDIVHPALTKWLKKNKAKAINVVNQARAVSNAREQASELVEAAAKTKAGTRNKSNLPLKLISALNVRPDLRELTLLEGDSAAGSAEEARLSHQEVLPLRGKIPNVIADGRKAFSNEEILDIVTSCGYNPKEPSAPGRVGKLIILSDSDEDGRHIASLILAMVYKIMPSYFEKGMIHVVKAPLFIGRSPKGEQIYGNKLSDLGVKATHIERLKGWGSCSATLLRTLAFDPKTRTTYQVRAVQQKERVKFEALMGKDSEARRVLMGFAPSK